MAKLLVLTGDKIAVDGVPDTIRILPLGHVKSQKGDFEVDEESYKAMKSHMEQRGLDIVVDYEHQTLDNVQAPAGGWIKDISLADEAIVAKVEWTEKAKEYLANKEYRYLSPVILVRPSDQKAVRLHSVALTNTPAIDGMFPIINSVNVNFDQYEEDGGNTMDLKALAKELGLPEAATEEEILAKLKEVLAENEKAKAEPVKKEDPAKKEGENEVVANKQILELLNLKEDAKVSDVAAKIVGLQTASTGVSAEEFKALKDKLANDDADKAVMMALKTGKISSAQKDWAKGYALKDPTGFDDFVAKAPQVVPMGEIQYDMSANKADIAPDETSLKVCKMMGVSDEDIKKYGGK